MTSTGPDISRQLETVVSLQTRGLHDAAIDLLRRALAQDPDHALAHALLARSLIQKKRLHAALLESQTALGIEPELPLAHLTLAAVSLVQRKLDDAERHADAARALDPDDADPLLLLSHVASLRGDREGALRLAEEARALEPDELACTTRLGDLLLERGDVAGARACAEQALSDAPDAIEAHVLAGDVALREGDVERAREHARTALRIDATDGTALTLLASVRARDSWFLGLWWRYQSRMRELGDTNQIAAMVGAFVVIKLVVIVLLAFDMKSAAALVGNLWLAVCAYTWIGPGLFQRALEKELASVRLKDF